jgi:cobalt-zinc-cadmium efflux system outer membrane protein
MLDLENAVSRADQTLRASRSRLWLLLGRSGPARLFEASGEFRRQAIAPEEMEHTALKQRPDFLAAEAEENRADAEVRLQLAQSHMDVTFGTEYRRQQGINGKGNSLGFTVSVPLPLFNKNQGEIARARAEKNRAALETSALRAQVITEIRAALDLSETSRAQLDRIESVMLVQARRVREITNYSYQRGEASLLQFLDAERAYNDTMRSYADARAEYAKSLYLYEAAMGKEAHP